MGDHVVRRISAERTHALRLRVLRPGAPPDSAVFPGDDDPRGFHLGAFADASDLASVPVGIASVHAASHPELGAGFRLRGMAVAPDRRRLGIGAALVAAALDGLRNAARDPSERILWCNARTAARSFYASMGFEARDDVFEISGIGPHVLMWRPICNDE